MSAKCFQGRASVEAVKAHMVQAQQNIKTNAAGRPLKLIYKPFIQMSDTSEFMVYGRIPDELFNTCLTG